MTRVYLLGTRGIPPRHGAFEQFCDVFVRVNRDYEFVVQGVDTFPQGVYETNVKGFRIPEYKIPGYPILYDLFGYLFFVLNSRREDIAIIFGYTASPFLLFLLLFRRKFIINMDGYEYKRDKFGYLAKSYLKFAEWCAVKLSRNIIVDSTDLLHYFKGRYGVKCHLIAYGRDEHVALSALSLEEIVSMTVKCDFFLSIMRMEPENNYKMIIESYLNSHAQAPLFIVGPSTPLFSKYWRRLKEYKNLSDYEVHYLGPIYDRSKLNKLRSMCTLYVHGHSVGGMNPVLIESLSFDIIKVCFDTPHNREVVRSDALFFKEQDDLISIFNNYRSLKDVVPRATDKENRFSWNTIINKYRKVIDEAI